MSQEHDFIQLIYQGEINSIYKFLKETNIKPYQCRDDKSYTALHIASLNGDYRLFEFLITYIKRNYKDWITCVQE